MPPFIRCVTMFTSSICSVLCLYRATLCYESVIYPAFVGLVLVYLLFVVCGCGGKAYLESSYFLFVSS